MRGEDAKGPRVRKASTAFPRCLVNTLHDRSVRRFQIHPSVSTHLVCETNTTRHGRVRRQTLPSPTPTADLCPSSTTAINHPTPSPALRRRRQRRCFPLSTTHSLPCQPILTLTTQPAHPAAHTPTVPHPPPPLPQQAPHPAAPRETTLPHPQKTTTPPAAASPAATEKKPPSPLRSTLDELPHLASAVPSATEPASTTAGTATTKPSMETTPRARRGGEASGRSRARSCSMSMRFLRSRPRGRSILVGRLGICLRRGRRRGWAERGGVRM